MILKTLHTKRVINLPSSFRVLCIGKWLTDYGCLFLDTLWRANKLQEEGRRYWIVEVRVLVRCQKGSFIQKLYLGYGYASLENLHTGIHCSMH